MNFRTTYALMGAVGALLVGLSIYVFFLSDDGPTGEGFLCKTFNEKGRKPGDINTVEIERITENKTTQKLIFLRQNPTRWRLKEPVEARIDSPAVEAIVRDLLNAKLVDRSKKNSKNVKTELDQPTVKVTIKQGADLFTTVEIGNVDFGDDTNALVYVKSSDLPGQELAVKKNSIRALFKLGEEEKGQATAERIRWLADFRQTKLLGDEARDVVNASNSVRIKTGNKDQLALVRNSDGTWRFEYPTGYGDVETIDPPGAPGADPTLINTAKKFLENIYNIQVAKTEDYIDDVKDFTQYGLNPDNPELLKIDVERRPLGPDDQAGYDTLYIGKAVPKEGKSNEPEKLYAKSSNETSVAKVNAAPIIALRKVLENPNLIRDRTVVKLPGPAGRIDALDIETSAGKLELRLVNEVWKIYDPTGMGYTANKQAVDELLNNLSLPGQIRDFPAPGAPENVLGYDNKAAEVKLWINGVVKEVKEEPKKEEKKDEAKKDETKKEEPKKEEKKEEKKETVDKPKLNGEPVCRLVFGKEVGELVNVRRFLGKEATDIMLPKTLLTMVKKPRLDYVDASILPFSIANVSKLKFTRGKDLYEIEKDDKNPNQWKILAPENRKGRLADSGKINGILSQLMTLRPIRILSDKPTAEELARWKVDDAAPKFAITLVFKEGSPEKERVYQFGEEIGVDKVNVYTKLFGKPMVYEVPKSIVDATQQGDLIDSLVYKVERIKIKGLKLRGWADVVGTVVTRELDVKDGPWKMKDATYDIDPVKVETFLEDIVQPRADAFVVVQGKTLPEHGLDLNKGALEVEIIVEGMEKPVTLMLGAADQSGTKIYAQTNQLPGDVFTLLKDRFKSIREKPAIFKKDN